MSPDPVTKLSRDYTVNWYDADYRGNARISAIFNFLQEAAWEQATRFGVGFDELKEKGLFWVIVTFHLKMIKFPRWTEKVRVTTWPRGVRQFFALRDFVMTSSEGEILGEATSAWVILDMERRRPQKADFIQEKVNYPPKDEMLEIEAPLIKQHRGLEEKLLHKVPYNEIDFNGHVNNTRYIEWCLNAYPLEFHNKHQIDSVLVNYIAEARYLDEIKISGTDHSGLSHIFEGTRDSDKKIIFRAEINWRALDKF
jgi:acyl-ACP thioesterase